MNSEEIFLKYSTNRTIQPFREHEYLMSMDQFVKALADATEWHRTEDEKPGDECDYLCFHPDWRIQILTWYQGKFNPIGLGMDQPTHWVSLPNPPEVKEIGAKP